MPSLIFFCALSAAAALVAVRAENATVCSPLACLTLSVSPSATYLSSLNFSHLLSGDSLSRWTPNLLAVAGEVLSTTRLVTRDGAVHAAAGGALGAVSPDGASVTVSGIALGGVAREDWFLRLAIVSNVTTLEWHVTRTYLVGGEAASDVFARLALQTTTTSYERAGAGAGAGSDWRDYVQMPSWLSLDSALGPGGVAYTLPGGGAALLGDAGTRSASLLLSPSGVRATLSLAGGGGAGGGRNCRFGVVREAELIVSVLGLGSECAAAPGAAYAFAPGDVASGALTLALQASNVGLAKFSLRGVRDAAMGAFASRFAQIYNMFKGWLYGNSPASETCIHEVSLFPQLQGMYSIEPAEFQSTSVQAAAGKHLDFIMAESVRPDGIVAARWSEVGGNQYPGAPGSSFPCLIDQEPHLLLAAYYHVLNTGDGAALARWMPTLDAVMAYMNNSMRMGAGALLTNAAPGCSGRRNVSGAGNWLDDIRFGWHDAIVGAYAVEAVRRLGELKTWAGDAAGGAALAQLHAAAVAAYNARYFNAASGLYSDWVDDQGTPRNYVYLWQQYLAIEFGIADGARAAAMLEAIEAQYAAVAAAFGVPRSYLWCAPTNLQPVDPADITVDFDGEYIYPHYENGACFHWQLGIEILARGRAGGDAAYERLAGVRPEWERSRLWGQRFDWLLQQPLGMDVITDGLFVLYGGVFGSLGVRPSLLRGIEVVAPPAAALEGARFSFAFLGSDATLAVINGSVVVQT